jgi:hypothetical protein
MDLKALLEKYLSEALTEEAKTEIEGLFEAAVKKAADARVAQKETALEEKFTADLKEFKESLINDLNDYMEESFGEWFEENKPALVAGQKVAMAESTMAALKGVFADNFVVISEEQIDPLKDLEVQTESLQAKLDESENARIDAKKEIFEYQKAFRFVKMTEGMTDSDREKLMTLVEDIEASDIGTWTKKVSIISEQFVQNAAPAGDSSEGDDAGTENPDETISESADVDPLAKYLPRGYV